MPVTRRMVTLNYRSYLGEEETAKAVSDKLSNLHYAANRQSACIIAAHIIHALNQGHFFRSATNGTQPSHHLAIMGPRYIKCAQCKTHAATPSRNNSANPPVTCLICPILSDIAAIHDAQSVLQKSGGMFLYRDIALSADPTPLKQKYIVHRATIKKWTAVKAKLANRVSEYEAMLGEFQNGTNTDEIKVIEEALEIWKNNWESCAATPSVKEVNAQIGTADWKGMITSMMGIRSSLLQYTPAITSPTSSQSILRRSSGVESFGQASFHSTSSSNTQNCLVHPPVSPHKKRVRINNEVRHSPPALNNLSDVDTLLVPLPIDTLPDIHTHSPFTDSHLNRGLALRRNRKSYRPGSWASPEGWNKVDTSCYVTKWEKVEKIWDWNSEKDRRAMRNSNMVKLLLTLLVGFIWMCFEWSARVGVQPGGRNY